MVQEGQDFLWPAGGSNQEVRIEEVGKGEPDDSAFGDPMGDGRVRLSNRPLGLEDEMMPGRVIKTDDLREEINPTAIQHRRSTEARTADRAKDAELTSDPLRWASDPSHYDFPGVDTGPQFREAEGDDFDSDSFLDSLF